MNQFPTKKTLLFNRYEFLSLLNAGGFLLIGYSEKTIPEMATNPNKSQNSSFEGGAAGGGCPLA